MTWFDWWWYPLFVVLVILATVVGYLLGDSLWGTIAWLFGLWVAGVIGFAGASRE